MSKLNSIASVVGLVPAVFFLACSTTTGGAGRVQKTTLRSVTSQSLYRITGAGLLFVDVGHTFREIRI